MDIIEKLGDTITEKGKEACDKAKELAEIARLKSRISTCEEVIKKNYTEIGKLYYEHYENAAPESADDVQEGLYEKQCRAIRNAKAGVEALQEEIRKIKGL